MDNLRHLHRPLGRWRTELLVRFLGLSYFLDLVRTILPQMLHEGSIDSLFRGDRQSYPWSYICGSLLLFAGARPWALALSLLANLAVVLQYEMAWHSLHYDELVPILLFLSGLLALAPTSRTTSRTSRTSRTTTTTTTRTSTSTSTSTSTDTSTTPPDPRTTFDTSACRLAQLTLAIALVFITLHKTNADFLGPTSCFHEITAGVADQWRWVAHLHTLFSPTAVLVADGLSALLFLFFPRLGLLVLFAAFTQWGLFGPVGSTMRVMVLALGFLDPADLRTLTTRRGVRTTAPLWTLLAVSAVLGTAFTLAAYKQPSNTPWLVCFAAYLTVVTFFLLGTLPLALRDLRAGRFLVPIWRSPLSGAAARAARPVLATAALLLLANEVAPYVGAKRNYTLKMWSNLRTDHERWNSLVVPEGVRVLDWMDRQIVTVSALEVHSTPRPMRRLLQGPVAPRDVLRVLRERTESDWFTLAFHTAGRERQFTGHRGTEAFQKFLQRLARLQTHGATLEVTRAASRMTERHSLFRHDLLSAVELHNKLELARPHVDGLDITLRTEDGTHAFRDAFATGELDAFLRERIPWIGKVWILGFAGEPQPCIH